MSDGMFRTVSGLKQGYDPDEVDDFFAHARAVYEQGPAAGAGQQGRPRRRVRHGARRVRHRGGRRGARPAGGRVRGPVPRGVRRDAGPAGRGWTTSASRRARCTAAWVAPTATGSPPPDGRQQGYEPADVDELCQRLVAYFDKGTPLSAAEVRSATFRRRKGRNAYAEGPVDAFLSRAVEVLLGVE